MSKKLIKVFLSGTRKDLRPFWAVAADAIRSVESFEPTSMDDGAAAPIPPDQWSRREATIPGLYLGLLGRCYGHVPSGQVRSLTEQEYDISGQVGIDRLVFLTEGSDPGEVGKEEAVSHGAVERFRTKVRADVVYDDVPTPAEFRAGIIKALNDWERRTIRGATASADDFYQPWLEGSPDFGHQGELLARDAELSRLEQFCASSQGVLVLRASWGQGKSRLLLELARKMGRQVRLVKEDAPLTREALDISAIDPCVVVLEDVQRRSAEDRRQLLAFIRRCGPDVKLIISSRPSHADAVLDDARHLGFTAGGVAHLELRPLDDREHRRVVAGILGGDTEEAHIIAQRTKGSILAGVVTARLFHRGLLTLGQIESGEEFRHAVLRVFEAALVEHERVTVDQRTREALRIVALAGPVRTDNERLIAALADFLGWRPYVVQSTLSDLVDGDLLIRRGDLVRVPVDALAEAMRRQACVSTSGQSLGYGEEALARLWPAVGGSLLRNLASLAFDLKEDGLTIDFLQAFWPRLTAIYDSGPASRRLDLLEELEETAPYAPAPAIAFVRHVLPLGLGPQEDEILLRGQLPLHLVHDRLAKLLEGVLFHAQHVGEACDLLWEIAAGDTRDPKQHTKSAERILLEAGELRPRTELARYQALLRWAQRRHHGLDAIPSRRLARYVKPLLNREMEHTWSDGDSIHMGASGLSAKVLGDLRREALDFLEQVAGEKDLGTIATALDGIGHTLSTNAGAFGRRVTPEELAQWYPEELESVVRIKRIRERHASRVVDLCVLSEIDWVAGHSSHVGLRDQAAELVGRIREHLDGSLELAVSHAYHLYRDFEESRTQEHDRDVAKIAAAHAALDASTIATKIREVCCAMEDIGRTPDPTAILFHLSRANPDLGEALLAEALTDPDGVLVPSLGGLLDGLSQPDPARSVAAAERILALESPKPRRALAHVYRWSQFVDRVGAAVSVRHLERLLNDADARVREGALMAIGFRDNIPLPERLRLLLAYDLAACPESGEEWAQAVHAKGILSGLSAERLEAVARKLGDSAELGFWSCEILETLSAQVPDIVVDMLVRRVPRARQEGFDATVDRTQKDPLSPLPDQARERGMGALGQYLGSSDFKIAHAAGDLFDKLATGDPESMRRVRLAWIRSGEESQVRQAAESLASEESEFLLMEEPIVVELLHAADRLSPEFLRDVESDLHAVGVRGMRTGTAGEVFARDVALRDGAAEIAARHPEGSIARRFYSAVSRHAQQTIDFHRRRDDERSV